MKNHQEEYITDLDLITSKARPGQKLGSGPGLGGGGVEHSLIWPIRGRTAGQGMVLGLSALNRV